MKAHHNRLDARDLGKYVLMPGSPERAAQIASMLDSNQRVTNHRGAPCFTGCIEGELVTVVTSGMGCPSFAIMLNELIELAKHNDQPLTIIRIGTAGGMQDFIELGDLTVVQAAVRDEGTTKRYVPPEFPAVANFTVVQALLQAATTRKLRYHLGIAHTKDDLNMERGQHNVPLATENRDYMEMLERADVLSSSMESAVLFIIGGLNRVRTGTVLVNIGVKNVPFADEEPSPENAIQVAIDAVKLLIAQDQD